ncbi:cytochrome d ubiquinol oxidase subunit II [Nocardiopsis sp. NRRL B-16309]|uniref:cytochrome d ubiquinol oxidase subunit II n=1 Tax=Nocardiopsis sp. NRRL B-16309 TaxID=1519494 RepID=UPI0006AE0D8E|nr:cytochrome d ubiquinol oxidase subunit II [Nocardiopsis sp. NRRL B-16309]KOX22124.1 cytochrome BD ubiquinol oxidase subunit II [Nocardiopsis sp. NRRL B-16309]
MDVLSTVLLALFVVGYLVLAGADIGLGLLMPVVARTPEQRRRAVAAIAPYFLASEVWLVAAVGVLAGLFPALDHHVVAELWPVLVTLLGGWLVRDSGLWLRARVDAPSRRAVCDTAVVAGSWVVAASWGLVLAGLLTGGLTASVFTPLCAVAVLALFALRGASFGAERLVGALHDDSADVAARATRVVARVALAAALLATGAAPLPGGVATDRPVVAAASALVLLVLLAVTSGVRGPMLSRHTSALAMGAAGVLTALSAQLPTEPVPATTAVFVWAALAPAVPFMVLGQVWMYRLARRPAPAPTFFA